MVIVPQCSSRRSSSARVSSSPAQQGKPNTRFTATRPKTRYWFPCRQGPVSQISRHRTATTTATAVLLRRKEAQTNSGAHLRRRKTMYSRSTYFVGRVQPSRALRTMMLESVIAGRSERLGKQRDYEMLLIDIIWSKPRVETKKVPDPASYVACSINTIPI